MRALIALVAACGHSPSRPLDNERSRHPCDPAPETTALPVPAAQTLAATCGDGKVSDYTESCTRSCAIGCDVAPDCGNTCVAGRELCDGADFDGRTCQAIRYGDGSLACDSKCSAMSTRGCALCIGEVIPCRELVVASPQQPIEGLELVASGTDVRAFWSTAGDHVVSAVVKRDLTLAGEPVDLGERTPMRAPVVATSKGWITVAGGGDNWAITFVDARGKVTHTPLGEPQADFKVAKVSGADEVIVISGDLGSNAAQVVRVDATGKVLPLPARAIHAANGVDRFVIAPLPEGKVELRFGKVFEVTAAKGDHVIAWFHADTPVYGGVARVHDGIRAEADVAGGPTLDIDGAVSIRFDTARDTVGKQTFEVPPAPAPLPDIAPFAPVVGDQAIARAVTGSVELRAGMVNDGDDVRVVLAAVPK